MTENEIPNWIRWIDIMVGIISIIAAILVLLVTNLGQLFLIAALSIVLFGIGLARVARAASVKSKGRPRRVINVISGISVFSLIIIVFTLGLVQSIQIQLIAIAWVILGFARIFIGILEKDVSSNFRFMQFIVGGMTILIGILIALNLGIDFFTAILLLAMLAGMNGLSRAARGYAGV